MGNGNQQQIVPTQPPTEAEMIERSVASFIAISRERDALAAKVDVLEIDAQAKDAEIKVLRDMLTFNEEQTKARDNETMNRIRQYQTERDIAIEAQTRAETHFEDLCKSNIGLLQAYRPYLDEIMQRREPKTDARTD